MKGLSLPINVVVVVSIAVLVMIVVSMFFTSSTQGGIMSISTEVAYNTGCSRLLQVEKCRPLSDADVITDRIILSDYNPTGKAPNGDSLLTACRKKFNDNRMSDAACKKSCGCPA